MEAVLRREDCVTAVRNYLGTPDFVLEGYQIKPFSDKTVGYMGQHLKLTVSVLLDGKLQHIVFFVKLIPISDAHRSVVVEMNLFGTEVTIYNKFVPKLQSCLPAGTEFPAPKCFFARSSMRVDVGAPASPGAQEIIILEDMSVRGYRCRDIFPAMDVPHCQAVLRAMAKFHASSILLEESCRKTQVGDFDPKRDLFPEIKENFLVNEAGHKGYEVARFDAESLTSAVLQLWPEKFNGLSRDTVFKAVMGLWDKATEMVKPSTKYPNVVNHGDPWSNNILFKYDREESGREIPVDAVLVDFQVPRYSPPILDILIFLHVSTRRDFRERHLKYLLKFYHEALAEHVPKYFIEKRLPYERLLEMYDDYVNFGRILGTGYVPIVASGVDELKDTEAKMEEAVDIDKTIYSDRGDQIVSNCFKSKVFREWITDSFQECLEALNLWD
ncbi:uncharacterized protein LOC124158622 [Ischnura elegans]|uniref:uncharacterized protein LOC124158622 n=1 Tax=Ischnura elegans TaxID=197161 RepID=UPI001ED8880D|nr:uncharacterized protein LOC124158622 [Ischnura elegans]